MAKDAGRIFVGCLCFLLFYPIVLFCSITLSFARIERTKIDTYLKTDCLVTSSSFEKCGITRARSSEQHCFRFKWTIEYIQYRSDQQATMILEGSYSKKWGIDPEDEARRDLANHRIGQIYPCYHSPTNRLREVQWAQPSVKIYTIYKISGIVLLLIAICIPLKEIYIIITIVSDFRCRRVVLKCLCSSRARNHRVQHTSHRRDQHVILIPSQVNRPPTIPLEEENIPLTSPPPPYVASDDFMGIERIPSPPPPYVALGDLVENERIPSPPPPPYVPSIAFIENENISSTPPPPYVRSSSV